MQEIDLSGRDAVFVWLSRNQLARRNISRDEFTFHLGVLLEGAKRQGERTDLTFRQSGGKLQTAARLAEEYQVSRATVERAAEYTRAVDRVAGVQRARRVINHGSAAL